MKNSLIALSSMLMLGGTALAQKVAFEEYDLPNGLHVILHNTFAAQEPREVAPEVVHRQKS
jgi:hypothetical protein